MRAVNTAANQPSVATAESTPESALAKSRAGMASTIRKPIRQRLCLTRGGTTRSIG